MDKFDRVSKERFQSIIRWISGAKNYVGSPCQEKNCTLYYMRMRGDIKLAAFREFNGSEFAYMVDKNINKYWSNKFEYSIDF